MYLILEKMEVNDESYFPNDQCVLCEKNLALRFVIFLCFSRPLKFKTFEIKERIVMLLKLQNANIEPLGCVWFGIH